MLSVSEKSFEYKEICALREQNKKAPAKARTEYLRGLRTKEKHRAFLLGAGSMYGGGF